MTTSTSIAQAGQPRSDMRMELSVNATDKSGVRVGDEVTVFAEPRAGTKFQLLRTADGLFVGSFVGWVEQIEITVQRADGPEHAYVSPLAPMEVSVGRFQLESADVMASRLTWPVLRADDKIQVCEASGNCWVEPTGGDVGGIDIKGKPGSVGRYTIKRTRDVPSEFDTPSQLVTNTSIDVVFPRSRTL